jgi:HEAT repeat protein
MSFLGSPDVEKMRAKKDVKGLIRALGYQKDVDTRRDAARTLGEIGDPAAVEPLIQLLRTESPGSRVQKSAMWALAEIGGPAVESLIEALRDENRSVRERAANALGEIRDTRAVQPLIHALEDEYWPVRKAAVIALGIIGDAGAVEPLLEALQDDEGPVRKAAEEWLHKLGWELDGSVSPAPPDVDAMAATGNVEGLIGALSYERDRKVREAAAEALGNIGDPAAVEPLISLLGDSHSTAFVWPNPAAVEALAKIGAPAVEPLIGVLDTGKWADHPGSAEIRAGAADALGEIGDPQAIGVLLRCLWDNIPAVRSSAASALGKIGEPAVLRLIEILELHGRHAPIAAAQALRQIMGQDFRDDAAAWRRWWEEHGPSKESS